MEPSSPPDSLTSESENWEKCPEKVLHQSLGEEGNDSPVTSPSESSFKDDTDSEDFVINQILRSINTSIVSESREHHYSNNIGGNPPCSNGWLSGHGAAFPPEAHNGLTRGNSAELHNGLTRGNSAELAGMAGMESVFYCDQGCFVLDQARRGCGHTRMTEKC